MVKNLEDGVKFLMFPRFVQVLLDRQVEGMLKHKEIYVTPSHTKKIFANIKRQGRDFSAKVTPLFETIMVQPQEDIDEHVTTTSNDPLLSEVVAEKEVNTDDPVPTAELVKGSEKAAEGSSKRAGGKLEQEDAKRQRIEEANESTELKRCLEIIPEDDDDDVKIEATPLSSKSLTIVDYKIYKERRKSFFNIIKADARFKNTKPVDDMDNLLFETLKIMFEHYAEDNIWKYQQGLAKVLNWKLFDSCRVYCVT
nr:hypothetical protein [Tanacetum cinerariifolium]